MEESREEEGMEEGRWKRLRVTWLTKIWVEHRRRSKLWRRERSKPWWREKRRRRRRRIRRERRRRRSRKKKRMKKRMKSRVWGGEEDRRAKTTAST
jgi:hypothetical protein